jgi:pectinesterase
VYNQTVYPNLIVAQDGTGDCVTIQEALNIAPSKSADKFIIYIKNGIYKEKIYVEKNNIILIGEDRDSTIIVYAELRSNWKQSHENDYGAAVMNIMNNVSGLIVKSLTIINNYGELYTSNDHQFTIRGGKGVTRIILDDCTIISYGGDTVSLWNTSDGMYYHRNCNFEGYVDYVCPRGYCFIEGSNFYGRNLSASIWHDGSGGEDHKFVIKNSRFDGVENFPLGRFHRDAKFYLINCTFSNNMANRYIYFAPSNPPRTLKWGEERQYFYNCFGDSTNYSWHQNNIHLVVDNTNPEQIDAKWTFNYQWDPVAELNEFNQNFNLNKLK